MPSPQPTTHLLYLHGFRSSPQSMKARRMAAVVAERYPGVTWWCPQLPVSPRAAMALILQGTAAWPRSGMAVIGSSLGGFYATCFAAQSGCRAVLLNPAVNPARDLARYIGEHPVWQSPEEKIFFLPEYVDELRQLPPPDMDRMLSISEQTTTAPGGPPMLAIIAKGDEVLDWREMTARYASAHIKLLDGGDHALSDFENHMEDICNFLILKPACS